VNLADCAFIALGSNLGNSRETVLSAVERLRGFSDGPIIVSSLWETEAVDCPPGTPPFINAVIALAPLQGETADSLLAKLQALEREFGRQRGSIRNEARTLDLDLIAFRTQVRADPHLTLPHPRAHQRAFVLAPLNEIAPDYVLPLQSQSVHALLAGLAALHPAVRRLAD
jgi:2-amino-4-hydroxy-6-hydroxymethyldihydropteridine diphosphokinase